MSNNPSPLSCPSVSFQNLVLVHASAANESQIKSAVVTTGGVFASLPVGSALDRFFVGSGNLLKGTWH
jgi:hypothetical protein